MIHQTRRLPDPARRHDLLVVADLAADSALRQVWSDLRRFTDDTLESAADRLVVFRAEPGPDQAALVALELVCDGRRVTRARTTGDRHDYALLHGDLVRAVSRYAGQSCPDGNVVAVDQQMLAGFWPEHCSHWDGSPAFTLSLDPPDLLAPQPDEPYCCPGHLVPALADRYGVPVPTRLAPSPCDGDL